MFRLSEQEDHILTKVAERFAMGKSEYAREEVLEDTLLILSDPQLFLRTHTNFYYESEYGSDRTKFCRMRLANYELDLIRSAAKALELKVGRFVRQTVMNHALHQL